MIRLITGKPGASKTARAIHLLFGLKEKGRTIYVHGIKDLDYERTGFHPIDDPTKWNDLPDGSVICIDEAYSTFPASSPNAKVPPHIELMATHRHKGYDFILIAQQPLQMHWFLRGLIEEHEHLKKVWNSRAVEIKRWSEYQGNTKANSNDKFKWMRDNKVFEYYTSTTVDTSGGIRIPQWAKYLGLAVMIVLLLGYFVKSRMQKRVEDYKAEQTAAISATNGTAGGALSPATTPAEYVDRHTPRLAAAPWSAPVFDNRQVQAEPQVFCMSSGAGTNALGKFEPAKCSCKTEQGTRYDLPQGVCQTMAIDGPAYNPYKGAAVAAVGVQPPQATPAEAQPTEPQGSVATVPGDRGLSSPRLAAWPGEIPGSRYSPPKSLR